MNGGQPPQAAQGDPMPGGNDSPRPYEPPLERAQDSVAEPRASAAPANAGAEESTDWQAHWIEPRGPSEPREAPERSPEPREVRERRPEPQEMRDWPPEPSEARDPPPAPHEVRERAPEPSYGPVERQDFTSTETSARPADEPSYRPEPEPQPPRPERSSAPHEEPRPPRDTVS